MSWISEVLLIAVIFIVMLLQQLWEWSQSHFTGADLQVSGCGKFQSAQTRAVFELMTQEGTALKSWIHNWYCRWTVPPWCTSHWAVGKIAGRQTLEQSSVCHVRANNVLFLAHMEGCVPWGLFWGQTSKPCSPSELLLIFWLPLWIQNQDVAVTSISLWSRGRQRSHVLSLTESWHDCVISFESTSELSEFRF